MYADKHSPLYDELRNQKHLPPALVDLDFSDTDQGDENAQIKSNLGVMYRQIVSGARKPLLFFGGAYRAGQTPPGAGTLENLPHSPIHAWCGNPDHNGQNMGVLYSAARDPIFYAHHSNVDRMWLIWKSLGPNRKDISDPDFLNTSFIFYNEKAEPVRVYVRDSLNTKNLGYVFQIVNIPWTKARPMPRNKKPKSKKSVAATTVPFGIGTALAEPTSIHVERPGRVEFPVTLNKIVSTEVSRPKKSRSKKEKDEEEEVLLIEGIEYEGNVAIKFDVFINDEDDREIRPDNTEFAGSFVNLPHINGNVNMKMKTSLRLGITEMLEDLDVDDDEVVVVTLVPRLPADGTSPVVINDIKIEYEG
ncbi:unnamed protein product [Citrullus colocynthis]|uniref:Tyrosinase copper-binding domain-containing protein n=1 Tax=Citrullus colocynthis TaxID=252529 RepID=A0ABP0Z965_9ROSI